MYVDVVAIIFYCARFHLLLMVQTQRALLTVHMHVI